MLKEQYRMHQKIMSFSSQFFYKNSLIANDAVKHWTMFENDNPVQFIDTAGTGYFESQDQETKSTFNREEALLLLKHFANYMHSIDQQIGIDQIDNIGIIAPYKAQSSLLKELFEEQFEAHELIRQKTAISTVDSFQGQERDIIYISLVRSNERGEIGFLSDTRRMNVAMTRARKKLVIIGDSGTIGQDDFYAQLLDYIQSIDAYTSAFELA